jgi:tungstate transport system substrate-binding protein
MRYLAVLITYLATLSGISAGATEFRLAVTTTFENSGLSDVILPQMRRDLGITIHALIGGTGQALRWGEAGNVDGLLVHSAEAEKKFVSSGFGVHRRKIMYNKFVIIGPHGDPAGIASVDTINDAFRKIKRSRSLFISRGDDSGTHRRELKLWQASGYDVSKFNPSWYRETGTSQGATLNTASGLNGYALTDQATWLNFSNKGELIELFSRGPLLRNQYAFVSVNPNRHPSVNYADAMRIEAWLASPHAQKLIGDYHINGKRMFIPNAQTGSSKKKSGEVK